MDLSDWYEEWRKENINDDSGLIMAGNISQFTPSSILSFKKLFIRNNLIYIFGEKSQLYWLIRVGLAEILEDQINNNTTLNLIVHELAFYTICNNLECGKICSMYPDFVLSVKSPPTSPKQIQKNSLIAGEVTFTNGTLEFLLIRGIVLLGRSTRFQYVILAKVSRRNMPFEYKIIVLKRTNPIDEDFITKINELARNNQLTTDYCESSINCDILNYFDEENFAIYGVQIIFNEQITENEIGNNLGFELNLIDPRNGQQFIVPIIIETRFVQRVYNE